MISNKEIKAQLKERELTLKEQGIILFAKNDEYPTEVYLTSLFLKKCRKGKIWNTPQLLSTLQNCWYGVDMKRLKSPGGKDGIFMLDRDFTPRNEMQRKIFDQFIDKPNSGFEELCQFLKCQKEEVIAVRVVHHHMRLLGILQHNPNTGLSRVVLVDFDINEHS